MAKKSDIVLPIGEDVGGDTIAAAFSQERIPASTQRVIIADDLDENEMERDAEMRRLQLEIQAAEEAEKVTASGMPEMPDADNMTMKDVMIMLASALKQISAGQVDSQRIAAKALESAQRQVQPDNRLGPDISVFNPQGEYSFPKPKLRCPMFIPWETENESCTWEEVELLNLLEAGEYVIKRNDKSKVGVIVRMIYDLNGKPSTLFMNSETAYTEESFARMPALTDTLRQILASRPHTRVAADKVITMDDRYSMVSRGELEVSVGVR